MTSATLFGAAWRKSTRSACDGACVEVALTPRLVGVRDSKNRSGGYLAVELHTWSAFVTGVKNGEFDPR